MSETPGGAVLWMKPEQWQRLIAATLACPEKETLTKMLDYHPQPDHLGRVGLGMSMDQWQSFAAATTLCPERVEFYSQILEIK